MNSVVSVNIPSPAAAPYNIRIGPGLLDQLGALVREVAPAPTCAIISDTNVAPLYLDKVSATLSRVGYRTITHVLPAGEAHKTFVNVGAALDTLLNARVERATPVIALGGGVVGDLAGYVAASLLRGVPFIQVPTTLLSAVDASVGGKVGVDHAAGKNLIGAFHQPKLVLTDIATFATLPPRELRCGLAECVKHGIIRDADLFAFIAANVAKITACDHATMTELVTRNVTIKARIVEEDPFERGVRALLNLGHTFGHAIENVLEYSGIQHGEAVALGTVAAARLAVAINLFTDTDVRKIVDLFELIGLPTSCPQLDPAKTFSAMGTDKKVRAGKLRLVLPTKIGDAVIKSDVDATLIQQAIASLTTAASARLC